MRAWKEGVRGCAGCIWFLLWGKGKPRSPVVPNARGSVRRLRESWFHLPAAVAYFLVPFSWWERVAPDLVKLHEGQGPRRAVGRAQPMRGRDCIPEQCLHPGHWGNFLCP